MSHSFQPTSSTAKIAAGKAQNGGGIYNRHRRPKSCKYDTYRLRSRYSQVEENLFGEPLKNKLMARSRSMEALIFSFSSRRSLSVPPTDIDRCRGGALLGSRPPLAASFGDVGARDAGVRVEPRSPS